MTQKVGNWPGLDVLFPDPESVPPPASGGGGDPIPIQQRFMSSNTDGGGSIVTLITYTPVAGRYAVSATATIKNRSSTVGVQVGVWINQGPDTNICAATEVTCAKTSNDATGGFAAEQCASLSPCHIECDGTNAITLCATGNDAWTALATTDQNAAFPATYMTFLPCN